VKNLFNKNNTASAGAIEERVSDMDSDVQKILDCCEQMKECFIRLEGRGVKSFAEKGLPEEAAAKRYNAVGSAANTLRWFRAVEMSLLRAAFDPGYAAELEKMNRMVKK